MPNFATIWLAWLVAVAVFFAALMLRVQPSAFLFTVGIVANFTNSNIHSIHLI